MSLPLVTLITPGGGRPEAFKLSEMYRARQDYKGEIQWIVADDNPKDPVVCTMGQEHIFGALQWRPGINTLRYNFAAAIEKVRGSIILVWENDDAYVSPSYISIMVDYLKYADLVGETWVTYYNLKIKGFREMQNTLHASTCQTGFTKAYLPWFERAVHSGEQFLDIFLYQQARARGHKHILFHGLNLCVGMKGLPGRGGIGFGHTNTHEFTPDSNFVKLKQLVGEEDAKLYINMVK